MAHPGDTRHSEGAVVSEMAKSRKRSAGFSGTVDATARKSDGHILRVTVQTVFERVPWFTKTLRRRFSHLLRQWQLSTVKTLRRHGIIDGFARR